MAFSAGAADVLLAGGFAVSSGFESRDSAGFPGADFPPAFSFAGSVAGFGGAVGITVMASVNHSRSAEYGTPV